MTWLLFLAFLGYQAYQQYYVGVSDPMDRQHMQSALLMLSLTMIGPFFVSYLFTRATQITGRTPAILLGFISSLTLAFVGAWAAWKFFGGIETMRIPLEQALRAAVVPGVGMGIILAIDSLFRRRTA
jgi:membrane protease YdiL (CAAX protease family)